MRKIKKRIDGRRNSFEDDAQAYLQQKLHGSGVKVSYESEKLPFTVFRNYIPDFILEFPSGHKRYIETKGYLRPDDIVKMVAVRKQHPLKDIRIFFQRDNKISKKYTYSEWATKNGFIHCVGTVPDEWFIE